MSSSWPARLEFATGPNPVAVAAFHIDSDGVVDLAVAQRRSGDVQVWLGRGDGTFEPGPTYPVEGEDLAAMAVADVNVDTKPDLITVDYVSGAISVLIGQGNGTFASEIVSPGIPGTVAMAIGDVGGDRLPDIAVAGSSVEILRGLGNGGFTTPQVIATQYDQSVLLADLDRDRRLDLLTGASYGLRMRLGTGDGTFALPDTYPIGNVASIVAGQLGGGDALDVAVAAEDNAGWCVWTLEGLGSGTLLPARTHFAPPVMALAIDHLDRDADLDLAAAGFVEFGSVTESPGQITKGQLTVLLNRGDWTFDTAQYEAGPAPQALAIANLDRDGAIDVVVANRTGWVSALLGIGDGTLAAAPSVELTANEGSSAIALADLDQDGAADLVLGSEHYFAGLHVKLGRGDGTFAPAITYAVDSPTSLAVADLDGDGRLDVATRHANSEAAVLLGRGDGTLAAPAFYPLVADLNVIAAGDVTGDGVLDLAGMSWQAFPPATGKAGGGCWPWRWDLRLTRSSICFQLKGPRAGDRRPDGGWSPRYGADLRKHAGPAGLPPAPAEPSRRRPYGARLVRDGPLPAWARARGSRPGR